MSAANTAPPEQFARARWFDRLWWPMIILAIASTCVIGTVGSILSVICALICLPMLLEPDLRAQLKGQWDILVFPLFFAALGIVFAINADQPRDMIYWFNFTSLPVATTIYLLARRHSGGGWPLIIVTLAFIGALLGAAFGAWQVLIGGVLRAGGLFNNPNMYGHIILILGFMCVPGLFLTKSNWRWLFLAGPVLGIAGAVLSGSRGTLLAVPVAAILALAYVLTQPAARRWVFGALVVAIVGFGAWLVLFVEFDGTLRRVSRMAEIIFEVMRTGASSETGTQTRLEVYAGAWQAFLQSPLIGHGWADAVPAAIADIERGRVLQVARTFRHMHNDFLGFAAGAGIIGLAGFFAMMAAPLYSLRHRDALFWHRAYLAGLLISTYAIYGVLDAMFGFDTGISTFVMLTAILAGTFSLRDKPGSAAQPDT